MGKASVTVSEWMAELERLSARSDEGMTAEEWAREMDCSVRTALGRLKQAHGLGRLRLGRRRIARLDGRSGFAPVYQVVKAAK